MFEQLKKTNINKYKKCLFKICFLSLFEVPYRVSIKIVCNTQYRPYRANKNKYEYLIMFGVDLKSIYSGNRKFMSKSIICEVIIMQW